MAIHRITASADNTITNAYGVNLTTRGTGSNMGASDILEVFSIYGQKTTNSSEIARTLIQFPLDTITTKRNNNTLPESGSVSWILKLYNAKHVESVPTSFDFFVLPISKEWEEGVGLDMEDYSDLTYDSTGSNWLQAIHSASHDADGKWTTAGGDYLYNQGVTASFKSGLEDLEVDVSDIVEDWVKGADGGEYNNYGFGIFLSSSQESAQKSYYTKKFFARGTEFYYKRPVLEARWDSSEKDNRGNFFLSSSLATGEQNLNKLYLYNKPRGALTNIPGLETSEISASLCSSIGGSFLGTFTGGQELPSIGVYTASVFIAGTYDTLYDVWHNGAGVQYHTGTISPKALSANVNSEDAKYVLSLTNNNHEYHSNQTARFKLYTRLKNWSPNLFTVAQSKPENIIIEDALYKVFRVSDDLTVINYGSGSTKHTQLSYNVSGNYFDLDMSVFEPNYQYGVKFSFYNTYLSSYVEQPYVFKFRVVD